MGVNSFRLKDLIQLFGKRIVRDIQSKPESLKCTEQFDSVYIDLNDPMHRIGTIFQLC
jgi:hypothetical protein